MPAGAQVIRRSFWGTVMVGCECSDTATNTHIIYAETKESVWTMGE